MVIIAIKLDCETVPILYVKFLTLFTPYINRGF